MAHKPYKRYKEKMKTKNKRNYLKQNGITLIALVVTIVVLLILAGVSLNAIFSENGIIKRAQDAQNKMDQATENDQKGINELSNWLDSKINGSSGGNTTGGNTAGGDTTLKSYEEAGKDTNNNGILTENAEYTDSENVTVTIPKGFKVSDVAKTEDTDGEQTVSTGLVIQDKDGNEFVWVPVNYTPTGTVDEDGLDSGFKDTFKRTNTEETQYKEPLVGGYTGEDIEYLNMMKSVQKNKGFYIGRYEAGTTTPRKNSTTTTSEVVVKRDAYPYIYVGWGNEMDDIETEIDGSGKGAVYLSKHMYDNKDIGATSTLCYGVQWDAVMTFVADSTHSISNSTSWGNYKDNAWNITRTTASYSKDYGESYIPITSNKKKTNSEEYLLTTGASDTFKAKNIFDLAGNVEEWTMEAELLCVGRVLRGGFYRNGGSGTPASNRIAAPTNSCIYTLGFRSALYL